MIDRRDHNYAYTTLITRASYLAGVILLAHTLRKHGSIYPLIVLYTPSLDGPALSALRAEASKSNLILKECELLLVPGTTKVNLIAERFRDTWTKLRVFQLFDYEMVCYLDADMMIFRNMDQVFSAVDLSSHHIAANHACVCNLDNDPWAPTEWTVENCAYTPLSHPRALTHPVPVTQDSRPTYHLLNSGFFLYRPSPQLWAEILDFFNTSDKLASFKFPDQDFLATVFKDRWVSMGWQWNAIKTMRNWHPNMWRDDEVVCLHYIVDKPWAARMGEDGRAGYLGLDGITHGWWWEEYAAWKEQRRDEGAMDVVEIVQKHIASEEGDDTDDVDMRAIGGNVQGLAFIQNGDMN